MAAFSSIIGAVGVATGIAGTAMQVSGASKQAAAQERIAQIQASVISPLNQAVVGKQGELQELQYQDRLRTYGVEQQAVSRQMGTAVEVGGLQDIGADLQDRASGNLNEIEKIKQQATELDAMRQKREIIRTALAARSAALATATAQGASTGSVLGGAYGGIAGRSGSNFNTINQGMLAGREAFNLGQENFNIGRSISNVNQAITKSTRQSQLDVSGLYLDASKTSAASFAEGQDINRQLTELYKQITAAGGSIANLQRDAASGGTLSTFGSGLSSLGGNLVKSQETIGRVSTYLTRPQGPLSLNPQNYS